MREMYITFHGTVVKCTKASLDGLQTRANDFDLSNLFLFHLKRNVV